MKRSLSNLAAPLFIGRAVLPETLYVGDIIICTISAEDDEPCSKSQRSFIMEITVEQSARSPRNQNICLGIRASSHIELPTAINLAVEDDENDRIVILPTFDLNSEEKEQSMISYQSDILTSSVAFDSTKIAIDNTDEGTMENIDKVDLVSESSGSTREICLGSSFAGPSITSTDTTVLLPSYTEKIFQTSSDCWIVSTMVYNTLNE
jgi:hypothetical protein